MVARLAPRPGETMRDYRDRVLPIAELAIAPQRARVARTRDDFATLAHIIFLAGARWARETPNKKIGED